MITVYMYIVQLVRDCGCMYRQGRAQLDCTYWGVGGGGGGGCTAEKRLRMRGNKKDGEEFKCKIINKNMAI
jgi:hypothetical protein